MDKKICYLIGLFIMFLLLSACAPGSASVGESITMEAVGDLPYQNPGTIKVTMNFDKSVPAILDLTILPTNGGVLEQDRFELNLESGVPSEVTTKVTITRLGKIQIFADMVVEGVHHKTVLTVMMDEGGGAAYPAGSDIKIYQEPLYPIVTEVPPFDSGGGPVPLGTVAIYGTFFYENRVSEFKPVRSLRVQMIDNDLNSKDDIVAEGFLDTQGRFNFPPISNVDADEGGGKLDIYLRFVSVDNSGDLQVVNLGENQYSWVTATSWDLGSSTYSFDVSMSATDPTAGAMWIWNDVHLEMTLGEILAERDMGSLTVKWELGQIAFNVCSRSCFAPWPIGGAFISDADTPSADTVRHEGAHAFMYNTRGHFWWWGAGLDDWWKCVVNPHYFFETTTYMCAQTEGWADWVAVSLDSDPDDICYDFGLGPCTGIEGVNHINLETPNKNDGRSVGQAVEGRVATALFDLADIYNEGDDRTNLRFPDMWKYSYPYNSIFTMWVFWPPSYKENDVYTFSWNGIDFGNVSVVFIPQLVNKSRQLR